MPFQDHEILETLRMFELETLDIRTTTLGISLACGIQRFLESSEVVVLPPVSPSSEYPPSRDRDPTPPPSPMPDPVNPVARSHYCDASGHCKLFFRRNKLCERKIEHGQSEA